jgi:hypothetical protein
MKYLIPFIWLNTTFWSPVFAQEPVCGPIFSEIFNFNVGDKFSYLVIEGDATGDGIDTYFNTFSYEIIEKEIRQDTSLYVIRGELPPSIALTRSRPFTRIDNYMSGIVRTLVID